MESFEELGVAPEVVEALAAEGVERPTPLQEASVPVLRQGNNLVLAAGPGSGLLIAWAVPLLERTELDCEVPAVVVLTATPEVADRLAESLARIASTTGHGVAALGSPWSLPERAHVLLAAPGDLLAAARAGRVSLGGVRTLVVDQAQAIERLAGLEEVERVIEYLAPDAQRIVSALPVSDAVADLVERHVRRAVTVPAGSSAASPDRGSVRFRITPEPKEAAVLSVAEELLASGARHLLCFCRSEDRAADLGDYLTLHGFMAGAPGDTSAPVWLAVDALAARSSVEGIAGVQVVSCDVPADVDALDRRHGITPDGVVVVLAREVAHLKGLGRLGGYETVPFPPPARGAPTEMERLRATLENALESQDTAVYLSALEPLFDRYDPAEVAAAAVVLLRERKPTRVATPAGPDASPAAPRPSATPSWAKLFIGVGERDGLRTGDLVGAITGEAGVDGHAVGKIEIRENHSVVEVHDDVARKVIKALNGTTIKGRAVRADFDRPRRGSPPRARR